MIFDIMFMLNLTYFLLIFFQKWQSYNNFCSVCQIPHRAGGEEGSGPGPAFEKGGVENEKLRKRFATLPNQMMLSSFC